MRSDLCHLYRHIPCHSLLRLPTFSHTHFLLMSSTWHKPQGSCTCYSLYLIYSFHNSLCGWLIFILSLSVYVNSTEIIQSHSTMVIQDLSLSSVYIPASFRIISFTSFCFVFTYRLHKLVSSVRIGTVWSQLTMTTPVCKPQPMLIQSGVQLPYSGYLADTYLVKEISNLSVYTQVCFPCASIKAAMLITGF